MKLFWALLIALGFRVADAKVITEFNTSDDQPPLQGRVRVVRTNGKRRPVRPYNQVDVLNDDSVE